MSERGRKEPTKRPRLTRGGAIKTNYTVTLTQLEAQIEEVARRRLGLSTAEVEQRIDGGEWEKDEDNYELWSWLRGIVESARVMRGIMNEIGRPP